jgi:hypothetical protein
MLAISIPHCEFDSFHPNGMRSLLQAVKTVTVTAIVNKIGIIRFFIIAPMQNTKTHRQEHPQLQSWDELT